MRDFVTRDEGTRIALPSLSVLIPALPNRRHMRTQVFAAFQTHYPDAQLLSVEGHTWGAGLNMLAQRATGNYWLTCCDDTVPWPGSIEAARAMLDTGIVPQVRYFHPNGDPLNVQWDTQPHGTPSPWTRAFLLTPKLYDQIGPFIDATWYTDQDYSERLVEAGYEIQACDGFHFTHLESVRDWRTDEVDARERAAYAASVASRA